MRLNARRLSVIAVIAILGVLPLFLGPFAVGVASRVLAFALLVLSVDLLTGLTGMPSLGQVAYFGVGAYTAGLIGIHLSTNLVLQLLAGTIMSAIVALVTGALVVRTAGIVFLMVTLAFGELAHRLADGLDLVGGSNGLAGIPPVTLIPGSDPITLNGLLYWWILFVFLGGCLVALTVSKSPLGRSMRAVRESPTRAAALGKRNYIVRLSAYTLAGSLAGASGTAWTVESGFFSPSDIAFTVSALALLCVVFGGAGTLWGPMLAAVMVILVRDWLSSYVEGHWELLLGLIFVAGVFLLPRGIAGIELNVFRRHDAHRTANVGSKP